MSAKPRPLTPSHSFKVPVHRTVLLPDGATELSQWRGEGAYLYIHMIHMIIIILMAIIILMIIIIIVLTITIMDSSMATITQ